MSGLDKILDRFMAPLTDEVAAAYGVMVEAENAWVRQLDCQTWRPPEKKRRTLCAISPLRKLPDMREMLEMRQLFLKTVKQYDPRVGEQSTAPPAWILPDGHMPVTEGKPVLPGHVVQVRWRTAAAFRSGSLTEKEVHEYLTERLRRLEEIAGNYGHRRQRQKEVEALDKFHQAQTEVERAREVMMTAEGPFVGRLTSGESITFNALWTHQDTRTQFTLQHIGLLPISNEGNLVEFERSPERPNRHSSWGDPIVEVLGVQVFGRKAPLIDIKATAVRGLPEPPADRPRPG